ncbi:ANTAR domain-containing protein [Streptomyces sp. NBC_01275]|uniref:ANTAR domain-containing protein n=1 Tax=Streptomyces sp. NBC_01275 TaxID=2903807 RepID=UPI00224E22E7|nr:ANTAR domain-containing protein [Streptomyces sp. NBC_01275]MCX4761784.1 ANTAR domain-containing protein [Streptomyces sp. NBC_01275]
MPTRHRLVGNRRAAGRRWKGWLRCEVRTMHHVTTALEEHPRLSAVSEAGDAALAVEVLELRARKEQLEQALASRAVIDQARGMVMVLAPCTSERAWEVLVHVSQHGNVKLRDVAAALVATTRAQELPEAIQREWRRALRRLHALERR